jgi:hypothetical protein
MNKNISLTQLMKLAPAPIIHGIRRWWYAHRETHFLICAQVEEQRAREAQKNAAYYHKRAAFARSAQQG